MPEANWTKYLPLPDKRVCDLSPRQTDIFRDWMGLNETGSTSNGIPYPTDQEIEHRRRRERWKARYAGKGNTKPSLLVREEQIRQLQQNAKVDQTARRYRDRALDVADTVAGLPKGFFHSFIPDMGPWNPGGNFCPHCIHKKSPEGINNYFWDWDWTDPNRLACPYCGTEFPNATYEDNAGLILPRLGLTYRIHVTERELATDDWHLGDAAERFVNQPIHLSFSGNIRALRINWSIERLRSLGLAYALTREQRYADGVAEILSRFADVYARYPLQSYFQDVVDADPGFAVDNADSVPTVFKRNACISVYDGRFGYNHEKTTTRSTRVATGLWGSSRIAREITTTGHAFMAAFQAYDLVKAAIDPETRRRIEQNFLIELYLDVRSYDNITNKAGNARAARVAFGQVYGAEKETRDGAKGFHAILEGQFHADGSAKETPLYGHKPVGENLWQIPEMLRGKSDLYSESLLPAAFGAFSEIQTPWATHPTHDDTFEISGIPGTTFDVALERFGIHIPGKPEPPSEFAILNSDLSRRQKRKSTNRAHNRYFEGRHLACAGFGSGRTATQMYLLGEEGCRIHRHQAPLNLQLYTHNWEVFPDLGYICDHPGNQWVKATPSHQTVTIDGQNGYWAEKSELISFDTSGSKRYVDKRVVLQSGHTMRRAVVLLRKADGWPILIDLYDVIGSGAKDYSVRVDTSGRLSIDRDRKPRKSALYQDHSFYPLLDFMTAGKTTGPVDAKWGSGERRVRATVLSDTAELITYRSPGWRSQYEITDQPSKYFDALVLRNRAAASRFIIVYEVGPKSVVKPALENDGDASTTIHLASRGQKNWDIQIPHNQAEKLRMKRS